MSLYMPLTEDGPKLHKSVSGNGAATPTKDQLSSRDYRVRDSHSPAFDKVRSCFEGSVMELEGDHQVPSRRRLRYRAENQVSDDIQ